MRVVNIDGRAAVLFGDAALDLASASGGRFGPDLASMYEQWPAVCEFVATVDGSDAMPFDAKRLGAPSPEPRQIFAIGMNYRAHAEEAGLPVPSIPATFTKYPTCIVGPDCDVALPSGN